MSRPCVSDRTIFLCADDYALHPLVDAAVEQLTLAARLSATSCMTTSPQWPHAAMRLQSLRPRLAVGLHFNLTEKHGGVYDTAQPLGVVLRRAYAHAVIRQMAPQKMRALWQQQLDAFEQAMATPPDFIDGHQHVHQFPSVRAAMLQELQARYAAHEMPWVRSTVPAGKLWRNPKAAVVALLGGYRTTRTLHRAGVVTNDGFGGVYGFDAPTPAHYGAYMAQWLPQMESGSLIMCHPATDVIEHDAIGRQRPVEFTYLMSDAFGALLQQTDFQVHQGPGKPPDAVVRK